MSLDKRTLTQFVQMAAESSEYPYPRKAKATPEVIREAKKFEKDVERALKEWVKKNPLAPGFDADDLMDAEGAYLVLMTLRGEGVGIWDGDWDDYFNNPKEIKVLEQHLKRKVGKYADETGTGSLNMAFDNAAYDTCGGAELDEAMGTYSGPPRKPTKLGGPVQPKWDELPPDAGTTYSEDDEEEEEEEMESCDKAKSMTQIIAKLVARGEEELAEEIMHLGAATRYNVDGEELTKSQMLKRAKAKEFVYIGSKPTYHAVMEVGKDSANVFPISQQEFDKLKVKDITTPKSRERMYDHQLEMLKKKKLSSMQEKIDFNMWVKENKPSAKEKVDYLTKAEINAELDEATAASKDAISQYYKKAETAFLKSAANLIQKLVGGKAKAEVKEGIGISWLEVSGVDKSDIEFDSTFTVFSVGDNNAILDWEHKGAMVGTDKGKKKYKTGMLTPKEVLSVFTHYWGY